MVLELPEARLNAMELVSQRHASAQYEHVFRHAIKLMTRLSNFSSELANVKPDTQNPAIASLMIMGLALSESISRLYQR